MKITAGTSGYAFKEWKGTFYPSDMKPEGMLAFYASRFPTVEINNTFYRMPRENVLLEWAAAVPDGFSFAIKASQRITHHARLKPDCADLVAFLLKNTALLEDHLGPVLFQLPPNMKKDIDRLRGFLDLLPAERRFVLEFRHASWFEDDVYALLRSRDVAMCVAEQDEFKCPVVCTASWGYLRLHRLDYDEASLAEWARCVASQPWSEAYVYFKHDEGVGSGPPAVDAFVGAVKAQA